MNDQPKPKRVLTIALAVTLWVVTVVLGLNLIDVFKQLFILVFVLGGGARELAEQISAWLVLVLAVAYLVFIVVTTEFHRVRVGKPASWRLFAWTLGVELAITLIYYLI